MKVGLGSYRTFGADVGARETYICTCSNACATSRTFLRSFSHFTLRQSDHKCRASKKFINTKNMLGIKHKMVACQWGTPLGGGPLADD